MPISEQCRDALRIFFTVEAWRFLDVDEPEWALLCFLDWVSDEARAVSFEEVKVVWYEILD